MSGPAAALWRAVELQCDCVQLFLRPNRQWQAAPLTEDEVGQFHTLADMPLPTFAFQAGIKQRMPQMMADGNLLGDLEEALMFDMPTLSPIVSHADYLINVASPPGVRQTGEATDRWAGRSNVRAKSIAALKDELQRAGLLGVPYVVLHPGSHMGDGEEVGLRRAVEAIDEALDGFADAPMKLLIETTAGQGTALGYRLEHVAFILKHAAHPARLGLCCDTCHMFAAGYDFRAAKGYDETIREIDRLVGLAQLKVWHLNDALRERGSRVDRHAHIGRGRIGREGFRRLVTDARFADHPMIIETPKYDARGRAMDPVNLRLLRRLAGQT